MQSTAVQTKTYSTQETKQKTSSKDKETSTNPELVDPFLQIIMSLLTQSSEQSSQTDGGTSDTSQLSKLTALLQNSSAGMTALLATMLNGETSADSELTMTDAATLFKLMNVEAMNTSERAAANIALGTQANAQAALYSDQLTQANNLSDMLALSAQNTNTAGTIAISSDALAQMTKLLGLSDKNELQSLLKNSGVEVISGEAVSAQDGLSDAIVKAKQMLSDYLAQQSDTDEIDVDNLQNELAKASTTTLFELSLKSSGETTDVNTLEQITEGIKQNISLGKSEFTIKLTPETLGEITVKLVEAEGKTTLTISTANEQAAKIINKEIDALREAVAPMNVEVRNAVTSTNESAGGSMQQYNMSGQQFAQQQFTGQQSFLQMTQIASGHTGNQTSDDTYALSQSAQMTTLAGSRLDAYI